MLLKLSTGIIHFLHILLYHYDDLQLLIHTCYANPIISITVYFLFILETYGVIKSQRSEKPPSRVRRL